MAGNSPRFRHLDDLPWQEVRRQQHGDHTASVWEKWPEFSDRYLTVYARYDPGMIVQPHGHNSDHIVFVIEGDIFGPFVAGPNGCVLFEVMMGDPRSFPGDLEEYEKFLADEGVQQLPNPPIDMPDWLPDTRN